MKAGVGTTRRVAAASAVGLGFLCAAAVLIAYGVMRSRDALVWVDRTHTVIDQIGRLEGHLSAAEAAQRTYLITSDSSALATYRAEQAGALAALQDLQDSTRDHPRQQERLRALGPLLREQAAFRERVVRTAQKRDSEAVAALLRSPEVVSRRAEIQARLRDASTEEIALLAARHRQRARAATVLDIALAASLAVAALLGIWAILLLRREVARSAGSERRERELIEQASDGIFVAGPGGPISAVNEAGCRMLGCLPEEVVGRSLPEFLRQEDAERFARVQARLRVGETDLGEWWLRRTDGALLPVELSSKILPDGRWQGIARDVTERHRAQEALAASEARYRRIVETASEGIWILDRDGRTSFVNERMAAMLGYTVAEMLGRIESDFLGEPGRRLAVGGPEAGTAEARAEARDVRLVRRDASDCWTMVSTTPIRAPDGSYAGALCMVTDVTERRQLEEDLRQAQKMDAMGRMAAAVAHDFNNLLTVIRSAATLLREGGPASPSFAADLDEIDSATNRAASLTAHLLAFCRRQPSQPGFVRVGPLLREFAALLPRLVPPPVRIELAIEGPDVGVWGDPIQLEQVLINLAVNARDAMPAGGTLRLGCGVSSFPSAVPHRHGTIPAGEHVAFTMADTGSGMSAEVQSHLFEPFYTTKGHGEGTGLGLATVYGIVRQAGGTVVVESQPGRGATFTVYLPRAQEPGALPATEPTAAADARERREGGAPRATGAPTAERETVLVVDDEDGVRHVAGRVLERLGYRVLTAATGLEALDIMLRERSRIRALVTDVRMPGITGIELVELLRTGGMDLPVLFISGQPDTVVPARWETAMPRRFLAKPFEIEIFTAEVGALMDAA